jgi:hypothetical protein
LGAGGTRLPTRLPGVGFFNAVLACPTDGAFFDATLVRTTDGTFFAALVFGADAVFFGGFVSSVVVDILIPSFGWWLKALTDR